MRKINLLLSVLTLLILLLPTFGYADPIVVACAFDCNFEFFIKLIKNVLNAFVYLSLLATVLVISYAGYNFLTQGDNPGVRSSSKKMLGSSLIGLAWVIGAWFIINTLLSFIIKDAFIFVK